jgi:hypothetical protein
MEDEIDQVLKSHVAGRDEAEVKGKLLGAGFVVVDKNGSSKSV